MHSGVYTCTIKIDTLIMRPIILDTETTGLEPAEDHRIIENRLRGVDVLAASRCKRKFESSLANQAIISNVSKDFVYSSAQL